MWVGIIWGGLWACGGPGPEPDDTAPSETGAPDTSGVETGQPAETADTVDTADAWQDQLVGGVSPTPVGPLSFFVCLTVDEEGRGPVHLYDGTPTVLSFIEGQNVNSSEQIGDELQAEAAAFQGLGLKVITITGQSNKNWDRVDQWTNTEVWSDPDGELGAHYSTEGGFGSSTPVTLLLDGEGNLLVYYEFVPVLNPVGATHASDVLADYVLWTEHNP